MSNIDAYSELYQLANSLTHSSPDLSVLLIADENFPIQECNTFAQIPNLSVITNRYDISKAFETHVPAVNFSDFDFTDLTQRFDIFIYRISKERPVVHHIFNSLRECASENSVLLVSGKKNDGIKGYHKKLEKECGYNGRLVKIGDQYIAQMNVPTNASIKLEDKQYSTLRRVQLGPFGHIYSKPGLYGWDKEDKGSQFLIDTIIDTLQLNKARPNRLGSLLDLGCGYGYLTMRLLQHATFTRIIATDNNATAVMACTKNLKANALSIEFKVIADDCAASLKEKFDLIVCNPPFHKGFDTEKSLTDLFPSRTAQLLNPAGTAFFVVNNFIPIEKTARKYFSRIKICAKNNQFTVVSLQV